MKLIAKLFLALLFVVGMNSVCHAEDGYCSGVEILQTAATLEGTNPSYQIQARSLQPTNSCGNWVQNRAYWFTLDPINGPAMYATALTAISLQKKIAIVPAVSNSYVSGRKLISITVAK